MPVEVLRNDLIEIKKKFILRSISIMGGEPLLHPYLKEIISEIHNIFPSLDIYISSNGILIPSLSADMLDFFKENNVKFILSKYPDNTNIFNKIMDTLGDKDIGFSVFVRNKFRKYINRNGNSNKKICYERCVMKHCTILQNGKIYICPFSAFIKIYNNKFGKNIDVDNGIDIYKNDSKTILKYISNPIETCKWCTFDKSFAADYKWERADKDLVTEEDWLIE